MKSRFVAYILLVIGLGFVLLGSIFAIFGSPSARAAAERAERLQPVAAHDIDARPVGSDVLVEGRISDNNKTHTRGFVSYVREEYQGEQDGSTTNNNSSTTSGVDNRERWQEDERITPPLVLDLADGPTQIGNSDYQLEHAPNTWQDTKVLYWNGFTGEGTKRYSGFKTSDAALVIGTISDSNEGHVIHADVLYGGDRARYIAGQHSTAVVMLWIGVGFAIAGAVLTGFGVWRLFKG